MTEYGFHPAANIFPLLTDEKLADLANDIKANGLIEPIILCGGLILDGRNRYRACQMASVEPKFTDAQIEFPMRYVLSTNLHRRHLTRAEQVDIGLRAMPELEKESKERQNATHNQKQALSPWDPAGSNGSHAGKTAQLAADLVGVGRNTIARAKQVRDQDPELYEQVRGGNLPVNTAYRALKDGALREELRNGGGDKRKNPRPDKQAEYKLAHKKAELNANSQKNRMGEGLYRADAICAGLSGLDFGMIRAVCTDSEIKHWAAMAVSLATSLRRFANKLREKPQCQKAQEEQS